MGEHTFLHKIEDVYKDNLFFYKGGAGFYDAGELSAKDVSAKQHKEMAQETLNKSLELASSGDYQLVVCDEINNAVHEGLLTKKDLSSLISKKHTDTNLCLTGRDFPESLLENVDIATNMTKLKHHFDDKFLANKGIDY